MQQKAGVKMLNTTYPLNQLKTELKKHIYGVICIWTDEDEDMHIRIDNKFFSIPINLPRTYWTKRILRPQEMVTLISLEYQRQVLKYFIKDWTFLI